MVKTKPTKTKTRVVPASARTGKAATKVRTVREARVGKVAPTKAKVKPSRASLREDREQARAKTKVVKKVAPTKVAKPAKKVVSAKTKPAKKAVPAKVAKRPPAAVNKVRITDPTKLLYKVSLIGRTLVDVDCHLIAVGDQVLIRHRKERSSKMLLESFASKDVVSIRGNVGEKASILAYVYTTVKEFDGLVVMQDNGFVEVTTTSGDTIQLNRYNSAGIEIKISALEDDVVDEPFAKRGKASVLAAEEDDDVDSEEEFEDESEEGESEDEESEEDEAEEEAEDAEEEEEDDSSDLDEDEDEDSDEDEDEEDDDSDGDDLEDEDDLSDDDDEDDEDDDSDDEDEED